MLVPPQPVVAKLEDKIELNSRYVEYRFELTQPHTVAFRSGQYVSIKVHESGLRRSYSVCHRPDIDHGFDLLVDRKPDGHGVNYLEKLELGQQIVALAPLGQFVLEPATEQTEYYFIATGSGIAPFKAMITDLLQLQQVTNKIELHWGMRQAEDLFWLEDWEELEENFANFSFNPTLTQPLQSWGLSRGRVTDILKVKSLDNPANAHAYICGGAPMIADVKNVLQQRGFNEDQIFYEKFY